MMRCVRYSVHSTLNATASRRATSSRVATFHVMALHGTVWDGIVVSQMMWQVCEGTSVSNRMVLFPIEGKPLV